MGKELSPEAKMCPFLASGKFPSPIQASFVVAVIAVVSFFLTSGFMYRYIMLILISRQLLNLICSMKKALNDQNSSQQTFQTPSRPFNIIWKTLLKLLLILTLINLLIGY